MKNIHKLGLGLCGAMLTVTLMYPATSQAQTTSIENDTSVASMLEMIQTLLEQIETLQEQLNAMQGEAQAIQKEIRTTMRQGVSSEEVRKIQQFLATNEELYPERLVTGYYGRLTERAIERLQARHDLPMTGMVDEETRELLNEYFEERTKRNVSTAALWKSPGIEKAIKHGVCEKSQGRAAFCRGIDWKDNDDDNDNDDDSQVRSTKRWAMIAIKEAAEEIKDTQKDLAAASFAARSALQASITVQLTSAEEKLADAETAYDAKDYAEARELALEAEELAEQAEEALDADDDGDGISWQEEASELIADVTEDLAETEADLAAAKLSSSVETRLEAMLDEVNTLLEDAETAYDAKDYQEALALAEQAEDKLDTLEDELDDVEDSE